MDQFKVCLFFSSLLFMISFISLLHIFRATVRLLTLSNTAINFFIYAGQHPDFRAAFQQECIVLSHRYRCCKCRSRRRVGATPTEGCDLETIAQLEPVAISTLNKINPNWSTSKTSNGNSKIGRAKKHDPAMYRVYYGSYFSGDSFSDSMDSFSSSPT